MVSPSFFIFLNYTSQKCIAAHGLRKIRVTRVSAQNSNSRAHGARANEGFVLSLLLSTRELTIRVHGFLVLFTRWRADICPGDSV